MIILGINAYHPDAAACVLVDGKLVAAVAEERLGDRVKHAAGFPTLAIRKVLEMAGANVTDVDYVALGHDNNANLSAKIKHVASNPVKSINSVAGHLARRRGMGSLREQVAAACEVDPAKCRFEVVEVEHHLAHLASSFFSSDFEEAAGFSYDGSGDFVSGMYARCRGQKIEVLKRVFVPSSLGFFYTALCQFIGFNHFGEEYKVMGLSAYGQSNRLDALRTMLQLNGTGEYKLNRDFIQPIGGKSFESCVNAKGEIILPPMYTAKLAELWGAPRERGMPLTAREHDIAASCQTHFEEVVLQCLRWLHEQVPTENLVSAGGCALNGVTNARILRESAFRKSYIQCAASDDGTAIGAALYTWCVVLQKPRPAPVDHAYWGPAYSDGEIRGALHAEKLAYEKLPDEALLHRVAEHLNKGHVVGWYQGQAEWGPRALGNRSILAHPGWPGMKDLINQKIKRREAFRPFAPSILAEAVPDYFEQTVESPFMMHVVKIRPEKRTALAAVCHEDGTGRLQTVKRTQNARYYDLIKTFAELSGVPVVLNTSFNENEPIVDRPEHAINCYRRSDIDVLCAGSFIAHKPGKEL